MAKSQTPKTQISFQLSIELHRQLTRLAKCNDKSFAGLCTEILSEYVKNQAEVLQILAQADEQIKNLSTKNTISGNPSKVKKPKRTSRKKSETAQSDSKEVVTDESKATDGAN